MVWPYYLFKFASNVYRERTRGQVSVWSINKTQVYGRKSGGRRVDPLVMVISTSIPWFTSTSLLATDYHGSDMTDDSKLYTIYIVLNSYIITYMYHDLSLLFAVQAEPLTLWSAGPCHIACISWTAIKKMNLHLVVLCITAYVRALKSVFWLVKKTETHVMNKYHLSI